MNITKGISVTRLVVSEGEFTYEAHAHIKLKGDGEEIGYLLVDATEDVDREQFYGLVKRLYRLAWWYDCAIELDSVLFENDTLI